jgi:tetratricopeptide (TPR) repeat protein
MADGYIYEQTGNPLADGGLAADFVAHIVAVGGLPLLKEFLKKSGRASAAALHPDVLQKYCAENGIPYAELAEQLTRRSTPLVGAKDLPDTDLENLVNNMPQGSGGDDGLLAQASLLIDDLQGQVTGIQTQYDGLRAQYAQTLTEIAGRFTGSTLEPLLRETITLLRRGGVSSSAAADIARLQRELRDTNEALRRVRAEYAAAQGERDAAFTARDAAERVLRDYQAAATRAEADYKTRLTQAGDRQARTEREKAGLAATVARLEREADTGLHERRALTAQVAAIRADLTRKGELLEKAVRGERLGDAVVVCQTEDDFYLGLARRYVQAGNYDALVMLFDAGIKITEKSGNLAAYRNHLITTVYENGKNAAARGEQIRARQFYRQVIQLDRTHVKAHLRTAQSYEADGKRSQAQEYYKKTLELELYNSGAHEGLQRLLGSASACFLEVGRIAETQRNYTAARDFYRRIIAAEPAHIGAHMKIAAAYSAEKREVAARQCYRNVLRINPRDISTHLKIGESYEREGEREKARQSYQQALTLDAKNPAAREGLNRVGAH